jgi:hypothetical protein
MKNVIMHKMHEKVHEKYMKKYMKYMKKKHEVHEKNT